MLAYSTISQLGYMVMALGVGAWVGAVFHLFTHAFFKACLFLGAGSISHSGTHHSFDMRGDGRTAQDDADHVLDVPDRVGSRSRGSSRSRASGRRTRSWPPASQGDFDVFMVVGLIGAFLTAAYMTRCVYLTFFGEYRGHHHPHESSEGDHRPARDPRRSSLVAGSRNATAFGIKKFME